MQTCHLSSLCRTLALLYPKHRYKQPAREVPVYRYLLFTHVQFSWKHSGKGIYLFLMSIDVHFVHRILVAFSGCKLSMECYLCYWCISIQLRCIFRFLPLFHQYICQNAYIWYTLRIQKHNIFCIPLHSQWEIPYSK